MISHGDYEGGGGFIMAMGNCFACGDLFSFNPTKVPAFRGQPVCKGCMDQANAKRKEMGLEPHFVHPEAYEMGREGELG